MWCRLFHCWADSQPSNWMPRPSTHAGHPLRAPHPPQATDLHPRRGSDADARDRRQLGDLQPGLPDPAEAVALRRRGAPGLCLEQLSADGPGRGQRLDSRLHRSQDPGARVRGCHAVHNAVAQPRRRRTGGAGSRSRGHAFVLLHPRTPARRSGADSPTPKRHPANDTRVILAHGLWQSRFGGDRSIVGRDIRINGEAYKVVGVLPPDFELPGREIGALVPFAFTPQQMSDDARGNEFSQMIARLRPGATVERRQHADENDRRPRDGAHPGARGLRTHQRLHRFCASDSRAARRRHAPAAARPAGGRAARSADRLFQRREPAADARDRPRTRARDPDDARRGAVAPDPADAHGRCGALACSARSRVWRLAWPVFAR